MPRTSFYGDLLSEQRGKYLVELTLSRQNQEELLKRGATYPETEKLSQRQGRKLQYLLIRLQGLEQEFRLSKKGEEKDLQTGEKKITTSYSVHNSSSIDYSPTSEISESFKLGNKAFEYELGYEPNDFNTQDKTLQLNHQTKFKPESDKYESTESVSFGSPELGPARFWGTVSIYSSQLDI